MANILTNVQGRATAAGTNLYTASSETLTLTSIRAANNDSADHTFHIELNGFLITGLETPMPVGSCFEASAPSSKIVVKDTDVLTVYGDTDNHIDVTLSFLQQT